MGSLVSKGRDYKPMENVDLSADSKEPYIKAEVKAPCMDGLLIRIFVWSLESKLIGWIMLYILKEMNLIHKFFTHVQLTEQPMYSPSYADNELEEKEVKSINFKLPPHERVCQAFNYLPKESSNKESSDFPVFQRWSIKDFSRAYLSGKTTPLLVAERFITAVRESSKPPYQMSFFINYDCDDILKQATISTARYQKGEPISVLDGILVAVKDEIDCLPYPTTGGTKWLHKVRRFQGEAFCVKSLRSCGAIIVGKTNMHELGLGTSGINPHYGAVRNPYDMTKVSGGSSSGSAAVASAGLCPVTIGVDGGGSVRIPASLCGVIGFKPTFGRLPDSGLLPFNWTLGMLGIITGSVEDAAIVYAAISGAHSRGSLIQLPVSFQPGLNFPLLDRTVSLSKITLAKYPEWFNDCNDDIRRCCNNALDRLYESFGWQTIEVTLPEIEEMRLAHYITIGSECNASLGPVMKKMAVEELGWESRAAMTIYGCFSSKEYLNAQRLRHRHMYFHMEILKKADVIVAPSTSVTAYPIQENAMKYGELDYINGAALVKYQIAGNFLGLPAITVPVGYDNSGMPIGLQLIGRPWSEATLLHLAYAVQSLYIKSCRKPMIFYDLLPERATSDVRDA
ncbi:fatty acid amide hydrolase-like [Nymphaea colorata]|nr:fatty acid amide hydrolase-like [Nymphaea colorata]